jgi:hypothetical protein
MRGAQHGPAPGATGPGMRRSARSVASPARLAVQNRPSSSAVDASYRPDVRRRVRGYEPSFGLSRSPDAAVVARRMLPKRVLDES